MIVLYVINTTFGLGNYHYLINLITLIIYTMKKSILSTCILISIAIFGFGQNAWINELHYDNASTDVGEFVEIVIENPGNYTLSDFSVYLYNGSNGTTYANEGVDNFTAGSTVGNFTIYTWYHAGIQNGAPDGLALVYQGVVVSSQFLSYEGTLPATDGPANGLLSVDIGVAETSSTPIGESLQLSGSGSFYSDFIWNAPAAETPGLENNGQTLGGALDPEPSNYPASFTADATGLVIENTWTDATGSQLPSAYLVLISDQDNITPPTDGVFQADDTDVSDGSGALNIPFGDEESTFFRLLPETTYFCEIYPYTNAGANIDYKNDGSAPQASATTPYAINTDDFESGDFGTWSTYNVASDKDWTVLNYGGALGTTYFAEINGYNEDVPSNDWLISPPLDLDSYVSEMMVFYTKWKYGNDETELTLKYSTDYTGGDPTLATWVDLSFSVAAAADIWESSGLIDLSSIDGADVYIAIQYLSSGNPRRWDVDEIEITGTPIVPLTTITSPNGGEVIEQGESFDITWTYSDWTGNIEIQLARAGENPTLLVSNISIEDESWTWNVFTTQEPADDYKIIIVPFNPDNPGDESDDYFTIIESYEVPALVITEIMYNPPESGNDSLEFIEIYNNGAETVNLDGFMFTAGVDYTFPNVDLAPDDFVLVAINSAAMLGTFGVEAYEWTSGALSNGGEKIELSDNYGNIVDSLTYGDALPWDSLADGYGPSLTLCNPDSDNSLAENWTHSVNFAAVNSVGDSIWATPGFECQVQLIPDFAADLTQVSVGGSVMFTDLTVGNPIEWIWTFEGGLPDTYNGQTPPSIVYDTEGTWDVTLYVSDGTSTAEITLYDYIAVVDFAPPINLAAVVGPYDDVNLTWYPPGGGSAELVYDDDVATGSYSYDGYTMSTHMSPDGPCKVLVLKFYTTTEAGDNTFNATVYDWDGTQPGIDVVYMETATAIDNDWLEVDVSAEDITFEGDFVVGFGSINATTYVGYDANLNNGRSWDFDNVSTWEQWSEAYLIRAIVQYTGGKIAEIGIAQSQTNKPRLVNTNKVHPTDYSHIEIIDPINNLAVSNRNLLGYNVYRDDIQINPAIVEVTEYNDNEPPIGSHDYYVTAVYDGGESDPSNVVSVVVTDINELNLSSVAVYPNPTDGAFTIENSNSVNTEIVVVDIAGKEVYKNTFSNSIKINVLGLQKGMYLIRMFDLETNNQIVKKLIIK